MNIIFKEDGGDLFIETNANYSPQIGWLVKVWNHSYKIESVELDLQSPTQTLIVNVASLEKSSLKRVKVVEIWKQNIGSLTLEKVYKVIREDENKFFIINDQGKKKSYKHNNTQFEIV